MYDVIYEDDIIRLRKAIENDTGPLKDILNKPEVMKYYGESLTTEAYALEEIQWFNRLFDEHGGRWVIEDRKTGQYIGDIGIFDYHQKHRKGEIGFKLAKAFWGQGIMTKCLKAVLQIAFDDWGYNRVEALVDVRNTGCRKLLTKNGFICEGVLRESEFEHGGFVDLAMYAILKKDRQQ